MVIFRPKRNIKKVKKQKRSNVYEVRRTMYDVSTSYLCNIAYLFDKRREAQSKQDADESGDERKTHRTP